MLDLESYISKIKSTHPDLLPLFLPLVDEIIRLRQENEELRKENAALRQENKELREENEHLKTLLKLNSRNSSIPPSKDQHKKKKIKNNRLPSDRKPGAQKGHKGTTLEFRDHADHYYHIPTPTCNHCGSDLQNVVSKGLKRYQLIDLPEKLRLEVSEYQVALKDCPYCKRQAEGNHPCKSTVGYGPYFQSLITYLHHYQQLPFDRMQEFTEDFFGHKISDGFIQSSGERLYSNLEAFEQQVKGQLLSTPTLHADETGIRCEGKNQWVHVCSNKHYTYYHPDKKRGFEAMKSAGVLNQYRGFVVHDRYVSYQKGHFIHCLCNAHILRELKFQFEEKQKEWAKKLHELLIWIKAFKEMDVLSLKDRKMFKKLYLQIVVKAWLAAKPPPKKESTPRKRGRKKQTKEFLLLDALLNKSDAVLRFMNETEVPFDNNLAERDLRMIKLKQKISGGFRTFHGLEVFARIRGYISTAKKQGINVMQALNHAFLGNALFLAEQ